MKRVQHWLKKCNLKNVLLVSSRNLVEVHPLWAQEVEGGLTTDGPGGSKGGGGGWGFRGNRGTGRNRENNPPFLDRNSPP